MRRSCLAFTFSTFLLMLATFMHAQNPVSSATSDSYGKLPLNFEANQGQADPAIQYLSRGDGYTLYLHSGELTLALAPARKDHGNGNMHSSSLIRLALASANPAAAATTEDEQITRSNYFLGSDPTHWHANIPNYARVRYHSIYPGIDLLYYGNQRRLEHDFFVAPGADASQIQLAFTGAGKLAVDEKTGDLLIHPVSSESETLRLLKPVSYQERQQGRHPIGSAYKLLANNRVGFALARYDHTQPLIIDPILVYSTYLGGTGWKDQQGNLRGDQGYGIAADGDGNTYLIGSTWSSDFPTTAGALQTTDSENTGSSAKGLNSSIVFVSKVNPAGTALLYSTYLGGTGQKISNLGAGDYGYAIAIDSAGDAYITGLTNSLDFPTTSGVIQTTNPANPTTPTKISSAFVAKLDSSGSSLLYSTYLGGTVSNSTLGSSGNAIAVDSDGDAFVAGYTASPHFPVTAGAFTTTLPAGNTSGNPNVFVAKLNPTATTLLYSTYLGGTGAQLNSEYPATTVGDEAKGIAIDSAGDAFITGFTYSADFPVTTGAYQIRNLSAPNTVSSAFITKLNPSGTALVYSTFLGGTAGFDGTLSSSPTQLANAIAVDASGAAYVAGQTSSSDFPTTAGSLSSACNFRDSFVTKLNPAGDSLAYSTCFPVGYPVFGINGVALDSEGALYLTGYGTVSGVPTTPDAAVSHNAAKVYNELGTTAFAAKLNPSGTALQYATLLGDGFGGIYGNSNGNAIVVNPSQTAFVTGAAGSGFPVSTGALQATYQGAALETTNVFVTALNLSGATTDHYLSQTLSSVSSTSILHGQSVTVTAQVAGAPNSAAPPGSILPTGTVTFYGYSVANGTRVNVLQSNIPLDATGTASWTSSTLSPGYYYIWASYSGDDHYLSSNTFYNIGTPTTPMYGTLFFDVFGPPKTLTAVTSNISPVIYGQPFFQLLIAQVRDALGQDIPGIAVQYSGDGLFFSSEHPVTDNNGEMYVQATGTRAGSLTATASIAGLAQTASWPLTVTPAPLTVTLHPLSRFYGASNPPAVATFSGLLNGDTVTVVPQTSALVTSPAGVYSYSATLSGPMASNYSATILPTTLTIKKVPLYISAKNVAIRYGQTPPVPTAYTLSGFVNGDTAAVVTGAPILTTTVTSTTPVGFYKIGVQTGTLAAQNYYFDDFSNGEGSVEVTKSPLHIQTASFTIHAGDPLPAFTYTITGFLNGDTQATATTGAPVITTTAPVPPTVGRYYIIGKQGSIQTQNYYFLSDLSDYGILTVLH